MKHLNRKQKIGQLLVVGFKGKTVPPSVKELINTYHIGGIILFSRNIGTPKEVLDLTNELQYLAKNAGYEYPLLICIDQENGVIRRLTDGVTVFPGSMLLGATGNSRNAYEIGYATGKELKALGINWNLAPVADVNNNPLNPVIGVRSFGEDAEIVAEFVLHSMKGLHDAGVIATLKHFPGHGDTTADSHLDLPIINHSLERLEQLELIPFSRCIENGAEVVMTAHVYFPEIAEKSGVPATLSKNVITGLLREKLGFKGVVTTDCMEMNAISKTIGTEKGSVEAIKAGVDIIMISHMLDRQIGAIEAIDEAVKRGDILENQLDEALRRVTRLKNKYLKWDEIPFGTSMNISETVGSKDHLKLAERIYKQGVTIVKNTKGLIPLNIDRQYRVLAISPQNKTFLLAEDNINSSDLLGNAVKMIDKNAASIVYNMPISDAEIDAILHKAKDYEVIITGTYNVSRFNPQIKLLNRLLKIHPKVIVIALRNPYDLTYFPDAENYICIYEDKTPAIEMAVKAIYGLEAVSGKLPVKI